MFASNAHAPCDAYNSGSTTNTVRPVAEVHRRCLPIHFYPNLNQRLHYLVISTPSHFNDL